MISNFSGFGIWSAIVKYFLAGRQTVLIDFVPGGDSFDNTVQEVWSD
jgi:hypothetical protein